MPNERVSVPTPATSQDSGSCDSPSTPLTSYPRVWSAIVFLIFFSALFFRLFYLSEKPVQLHFVQPHTGLIKTHYSRFPDCFVRKDSGFSDTRYALNAISGTTVAELRVPRLACRLRFNPVLDGCLKITAITVDGTTYGAENLQPLLKPLRNLAPLKNENGTICVEPTADDSLLAFTPYIGPSPAELSLLTAACLLMTIFWFSFHRHQKNIIAFLMRHETVVAGMCMSLCIGYTVFRFYDSIFPLQLAAEEGPIFYKEMYEYGLASLFMKYADYLHTYQRLVTLACSSIPLEWIPLAFRIFSLAAQLLFYWTVWQRKSPLHILAKILICLGTIFIASYGDIYLCLTNAQWFLAMGLILILLSAPETTGFRRFLQNLYLLIAGLTGPFAVLLIPMVSVWYFTKRKSLTLFHKNKLWLFIIVSGISLLAISFNHRFGTDEIAPWQAWVYTYKAVFLNYLFGFISHNRYPNSLLFLGLPAFFLFTLAAFLYYRNLEKNEFTNRLLMIIGSLTIFLATIASFRSTPYDCTANTGIIRYLFIPYMTLSLLLSMIIANPGHDRFGQIRRLIASVILGISFLSGILNFSEKLPCPDVKFKEQVEQFRRTGYHYFRNLPECLNFSLMKNDGQNREDTHGTR